MGGVDVVKSLYDAYAKRDIKGALDHCADDVVFRWVAEPEMSLDNDFEYRSFRPLDYIHSGDRVAVQVEIHLTRRTNGQELVMRTADFWTVRDGKVVEMVEYYDTALAASVL